MATRVVVRPRDVYHQMNREGGTGGAAAYRDALLSDAKLYAVMWSPVNDPLNAKHRGGAVGTYKASWKAQRDRAPMHLSRGRLRNTANHAIFVELGRSASKKPQRFSWTKWKGQIRWVGISKGAYLLGTKVSGYKGTRSRPGRHIAERAVTASLRSSVPVMAARLNSPYTRTL